jgi:colanic acid/amylovoran biosynthesis glycosyltransferase
MNEPLKIGLFVIAFPRASETFIVTKVLKLLEHGFDVQIFALSDQGDWSSFSVLDGRNDIRDRVHIAAARSVVGLSTLAGNVFRNPGQFINLAAHRWRHRRETPSGFLRPLYVQAMFAGTKLDVLHVEFDYQGIGIADLKAYFDCRLLLSSRGSFQRTSTFRSEARDYLFRYADGYHFISKSLDDNVHQLGLPSEIPCWHVEPAVDLTLFRPEPQVREPGPLRIVSVGRLVWSKGYEFAIDAAANLRDRGVDFSYEIYGSGPYEQAVRYAIREYSLEDRVRIVPPRPRHEVPSILANADVMLHAAIDEGFCNAVIEAQAMELPVVTTDAGGLPENVEDGVTGYVVSRRDGPALAEKLALLASNSKLRDQLGKAGRRRALERFDLDRQAEAFVRVYRELMASPRRTNGVP